MNYEDLNDLDRYKVEIFIGKEMSNPKYEDQLDNILSTSENMMGLLPERLHYVALDRLKIVLCEYAAFLFLTTQS